MIYPGNKEAEEACKDWQARLSLLDWDVKVRIVRGSELSRNETMGQVDYSRAKKMAIIRLIDPIDHEENEPFPLDHEEVLVHELMHVVLAWMDHYAPEPDTFERVLWDESVELTIDQTARGWVRSIRQKNKQK
jgi:Zn-dependent M32 family carboxypeptidase